MDILVERLAELEIKVEIAERMKKDKDNGKGDFRLASASANTANGPGQFNEVLLKTTYWWESEDLPTSKRDYLCVLSDFNNNDPFNFFVLIGYRPFSGYLHSFVLPSYRFLIILFNSTRPNITLINTFLPSSRGFIASPLLIPPIPTHRS
jgi:hypothetical protein